jgi:hemerythrin-like domain-containing protein
MSSTTGSGVRRRNDTSMMYAVHDAFQRDLDRLTDLARGGAEGGALTSPAVRACWERFKTFLHVHHTAEDTHLWPVLRAKVLDRPADLAVLDQMEDEHTGLTALLDAVEKALTDSRTPDQLALHAERLSDGLTTHCEHEEELALPLVADLLTGQEWAAFGNEQRRQLGLSGAASFFPWLLDGATDEVRRTVLAMLPPPVRLIYRALWRPRYLRGPRWQALADA